MFKLIEISGDTIRLDDVGTSSMVTAACARSGLRVEGAAVADDKITLICSENTVPESFSYRFTALSTFSEDELYPVLRSRYDNNFRTVSAFRLADGFWTLTEKNEFQ